MKRLIIITTLIFSLLTVGVSAQTYNCKRGDTLSRIAEKYNTTISRILSNNPHLKKSPSVKPGQKVKIPDQGTVSDYEKEVARLVNVERSRRGLQTLTLNAQISKVARIKCQDMVNKRYFSHISPTYGSPFKMMESFGIRFSTAGENIAYGQKTPAEVMNGWMNSPGHRANILSPSYTNIGVGMAKNSAGVKYWTQMFTKPLK